MLMPLERMRVGINSERASHTHTPGPTAKKAMKMKRKTATSQPRWALGTGVMSAFSIFNGAVPASARLAKGFEKNATTLLFGTQLTRVISIGFAVGSSERTTEVAVRKSP